VFVCNIYVMEILGFLFLCFGAWLFLTPNGKLLGKTYVIVVIAFFTLLIPYFLIIYIFRIYYPNYEGFGVYWMYLALVIALLIIRFEWLFDKITELDIKFTRKNNLKLNQTLSDEELNKPNRYISDEEIDDINKNFPNNND
jgi:hypothetical protein